MLGDFLFQGLYLSAVLGGDGHNGSKLTACAYLGQPRQQVGFILETINLIDR